MITFTKTHSTLHEAEVVCGVVFASEDNSTLEMKESDAAEIGILRVSDAAEIVDEAILGL